MDGPRPLRRAAALVAALPALGTLAQFALQFNTAYYFDFREDAGARRIVARLGELRRRAAIERVRVGVSPVLRHSYDFYRRTQGLRWLELGQLDGAACLFDYYAFLPAAHESVLPKYRLSGDNYDEISGVTLARFDPAAVPQIDELGKLGYRDEIPCRVDFAAVGPVADMSRPDGPAHLLRDFLAIGEFPDRAWAAEKPALVLRVPEAARPEFVVDFLVHSQVLAQVGPQTLTFRLNGKALEQIRYDTEGRRAYRGPVPAGWLRPGSLALVEIEADKCFVFTPGRAEAQRGVLPSRADSALKVAPPGRIGSMIEAARFAAAGAISRPATSLEAPHSPEEKHALQIHPHRGSGSGRCAGTGVRRRTQGAQGQGFLQAQPGYGLLHQDGR